MKPFSSIPEVSDLELAEMTEQDLKELDLLEKDFIKAVRCLMIVIDEVSHCSHSAWFQRE